MTGVTAAEAGARLSAALGPCRHETAAPVVLVTGEVVAAVCESCLAELPASWGCADCEYVEVRQMCSVASERVMGQPCARHAAGGEGGRP